MKFLKILFLFFIAVALPAASSAAPARPAVRMIKGLQYFDFLQLMRLNGASVRNYGSGHEFRTGNFSCRVENNSRKVMINNVSVILNYPVSHVNGRPYVATLDWNKSFRPLLYTGTNPRHTIRTITIDMGHGGNDPGAIGRISREKNITLTVGRKLGNILRSYGYDVRYTRNSDIRIPLERVPALQRSHRSDLFVSIHVNSTKDRSVNGIETFCLTPAYAPSTNSAKNSATAYRGNQKDSSNLALAYFIQCSLLYRTGAADRGIKRARFVILRDLCSPGVLVEIGFISNRSEELKLNNNAYTDRVARGIAEGIIHYRNSMK